MTIADQYERYMLELINAERAAVGAPPLQLEQRLNLAAEQHSLWMLDTDVFSHTGVNGSSATQRMRDANFDFSGGWSSAENIAVQSERGASGIMDDVADLHTSLMNSPGHRANILNPNLDYIGIGIELGDFNYDTGEYESVIVTQNFASTGGNVVLDQGAETEGPAEEDQLVVVEVPEPEPLPDPTPVEEPTPVQQDPAPTQPAPEPVEAAQAQPAAPIEITIESLLAQVTGGDTFDFFETLFEDLGFDIPQGNAGPPQTLQAMCHDFASEQFAAFEATYAAQQDDLSF